MYFHINNFKSNHFNYSLNKIKILQIVCVADIPKSDILLSYIKNTTISLEGNNRKKDYVPYCLSNRELFNNRYSNRKKNI